MINLGKQSKLAPAQVVRRASEFFGPKGAGLTVHSEGDSRARPYNQNCCEPLAQSAEQQPFKLWVQGSIPWRLKNG